MPPPKVIAGKNYGSIPHLHGSQLGKHDRFLHEGQDRIIRKGGRDRHDRVIVSLKLDGTNVGVIKLDGVLITIQRKGYSCTSSPYEQHHAFDKWVQEHAEEFDRILEEGDRIVGEWLWQASGILYEVTGAPFFAFDYFPAGEKRISWERLNRKLTDNDVSFTVPYWFAYDRSNPVPEVPSLADLPFPSIKPVHQPDVLHEGWIYRVERKGEYDFLAKWVRADYVAGKYLPRNDDDSPTEITLNVLS